MGFQRTARRMIVDCDCACLTTTNTILSDSCYSVYQYESCSSNELIHYSMFMFTNVYLVTRHCHNQCGSGTMFVYRNVPSCYMNMISPLQLVSPQCRVQIRDQHQQDPSFVCTASGAGSGASRRTAVLFYFSSSVFGLRWSKIELGCRMTTRRQMMRAAYNSSGK